MNSSLEVSSSQWVWTRGGNMETGLGIKKWIFAAGLAAFSLSAIADRVPAMLPIVTNDLDLVKQMPPPPRLDQPLPIDGRRFPRLWIGTIRWEQPIDPVKFAVNSRLSPIAEYRFNFQIIPQLRTPENRFKNLPEGYYVLRMTILRPLVAGEDEPINEKSLPGHSYYQRYIAGSERLVQLTQGAIKANVAFRFHSISATAMRNTLLIQVLPVKASSLKRDKNGLVAADSSYELEPIPNYLANVTRIPFIPRYSSGLATPPTAVTTDDISPEESIDLGLFNRQADEFVRQQKSLLVEKLSPKEFAEKMQLLYLDWESRAIDNALNQPNIRVSPSSLRSALQGLLEDKDQSLEVKEEVAKGICPLINLGVEVDRRLLGGAGDKKKMEQLLRWSMVLRCLTNVSNAFQLSQQIHTYKVSDFQYVEGAPTRLALMANFGTNRQNSLDTFSSFQQGFNPLDIKGIFRLGYTYTVNETRSRSKLEGTLVSGGADLDVHHWDMQIKTSDFQVCVIVQPSKSVWAFGQFKGLYLCSERIQNRPLEFRERYYHIFPSVAASPTIDTFNPKNQIANMVLRGQRDYFTFLKSIHSYIRPTHEQGRDPSDELRSALNVYRSTPPALASIFSRPISLSGAETDERLRQANNPSLWDRLIHRYDDRIN